LAGDEENLIVAGTFVAMAERGEKKRRSEPAIPNTSEDD
jgi:hypothetical protein